MGAYSYAPYAYAHHYGYYGLGHHYGYYGRKKREATAEAEAEASPEADPWLAVRCLRPPLRWVLRLRLPSRSLRLPRRLPQLPRRTCPLRWKIRGREAINERSK